MSGSRRRHSDKLKAMAKSTGGLCFAPTNVSDGLQITELDTMLALSERPPRARHRPLQSPLGLANFEGRLS